MFDSIPIVLGGYLLGSIPTAYLLVRRFRGLDVRSAGSGKGGAFNSYDVTGSKTLGITVGTLDAVKGVAAVFLGVALEEGSFWAPAVALFGAIMGHMFPIWLRFRGGRGLATTAGGLFLLGFSYTVVWCTLWLLIRAWRKDILTANIVAILFTPPLLGIIPWEWVRLAVPGQTDAGSFLFFSTLLSGFLILGHLDVIQAMWSKSKTMES